MTNQLVTLGIKPKLFSTSSQLTAADRWDHILIRLGHKRGAHRVEPGLYSLGNPSPDSPVFVTANYTLSFDALRSSLAGIDAYLLVLDTKGINVWCAAGKGTFGTDEIVLRVHQTRLHDVVSHRRLILPQLGAPGVAAHVIKKRTGFTVEYGPVRAADLPEYLKTHEATDAMRQVRFSLRDRTVLVPVEIRNNVLPMLAAAIILYLLGGWVSALAAIASVLAGSALFPALLPWLPTRDFSAKGFFLGGLAAAPFACYALVGHSDWAWWRQAGQAAEFLLWMPAVTAYIALNFTGASTFTSRTGVRREMFAYIPAMAATFATGALLAVLFALIR